MADEMQRTAQTIAGSDSVGLPNPVRTFADIDLHVEHHRRTLFAANPDRIFEVIWGNENGTLGIIAIWLDGKGPLSKIKQTASFRE